MFECFRVIWERYLGDVAVKPNSTIEHEANEAELDEVNQRRTMMNGKIKIKLIGHLLGRDRFVAVVVVKERLNGRRAGKSVFKQIIQRTVQENLTFGRRPCGPCSVVSRTCPDWLSSPFDRVKPVRTCRRDKSNRKLGAYSTKRFYLFRTSCHRARPGMTTVCFEKYDALRGLLQTVTSDRKRRQRLFYFCPSAPAPGWFSESIKHSRWRPSSCRVEFFTPCLW